MKYRPGVKVVQVIGVLALALGALATASVADPPPARPDYLLSLPSNEWTFANRLWEKPSQPCEAANCEAGFFSAPLMVSVAVRPNVEEDGSRGYAVEVVAGVQNCAAVASSTTRAHEFHSLSLERRHELLSQRVRQAARAVQDDCGSPRAFLPTQDLRRLTMPPSAVAND
jgi:hypothetical protein